MYQQLSLYGSVKNNDLKITLHSLAAIAGMNPLNIMDHCIVCVPKFPFRPQHRAGEVNQIEQYRILIQTDLTSSDLNDRVPHSIADTKWREALSKLHWSMNISEIPEAAKLNHISQAQYWTEIQSGNPFALVDQLGYRPSNEYWVHGYEFFLGDLVVRIHRLLITEDQFQKTISLPLGSIAAAGSVGENADAAAKDVEMNDLEEVDNTKGPQFQILDSSGRWLVKAYVNVKNITDLEGISSATAQLEKFQADMAGLFDLELPEKKSFDTGVKE